MISSVLLQSCRSPQGSVPLTWRMAILLCIPPRWKFTSGWKTPVFQSPGPAPRVQASDTQHSGVEETHNVIWVCLLYQALTLDCIYSFISSIRLESTWGWALYLILRRDLTTCHLVPNVKGMSAEVMIGVCNSSISSERAENIERPRNFSWESAFHT